MSWLRRKVLGDRNSIADDVSACFRAIRIALAVLVGVSVLTMVALVAPGSSVLHALLPLPITLDVVALAGLVGLLVFTARVLDDVAIRPLTDLAATARRVAGGDLRGVDEPYGALELQQITSAMGSLCHQVLHERSGRVAERHEEESAASSLRQILRLTKEVGGTFNVERILETVAHGAMSIGGYHHATVWLVDELNKQFSPAYTSDMNSTTEKKAVAFGDDAVSRAVTTAQTVTVRDDAGDGIAVPLVMGLSVLGVVELKGASGDAPIADALDAIETLASHAATAIAASRLHQEVEQRSETDGLTHLLNRRKLDTDLKTEVARSTRYGHPLSLVLIDVDHFKAVNDTFGHQQGDEALKLVALALVRGSREIDSAYRFGGEEFAVLLRETDLTAAVEVADRLRQRIREAVAGLGLPRDVTASLGVAGISETVKTAVKLVEAADAALYKAKDGGRNRVVASS